MICWNNVASRTDNGVWEVVAMVHDLYQFVLRDIERKTSLCFIHV